MSGKKKLLFFFLVLGFIGSNHWPVKAAPKEKIWSTHKIGEEKFIGNDRTSPVKFSIKRTYDSFTEEAECLIDSGFSNLRITQKGYGFDRDGDLLFGIGSELSIRFDKGEIIKKTTYTWPGTHIDKSEWEPYRTIWVREKANDYNGGYRTYEYKLYTSSIKKFLKQFDKCEQSL